MPLGSLFLRSRTAEARAFAGPDGRWWLESAPRPRLELDVSPQVVPVGAPPEHVALAARHRYGAARLAVDHPSAQFVHDDEAWLLLIARDELDVDGAIAIVDEAGDAIGSVVVPPGRDSDWRAYAPESA